MDGRNNGRYLEEHDNIKEHELDDIIPLIQSLKCKLAC
jgi:hypothetical protein